VAYISYNTQPGWRLFSAIRDMLGLHLAALNQETRIQRARELLSEYVQLWQRDPALQSWVVAAETMLKQESFALIHDHLSVVNDPLYLMHFIKIAADHGLKYLTDAAEPLGSAVEPPGNLHGLEREQMADFARMTTFRRSLLARADAPITPCDPRAILPLLGFSTELQPAADGSFSTAAGTIHVHGATAQTLLTRLTQCSGQTLPFASATANLPDTEARDALLQFLRTSFVVPHLS
jgi:hypothetical protein